MSKPHTGSNRWTWLNHHVTKTLCKVLASHVQFTPNKVQDRFLQWDFTTENTTVELVPRKYIVTLKVEVICNRTKKSEKVVVQRLYLENIQRTIQETNYNTLTSAER